MIFSSFYIGDSSDLLNNENTVTTTMFHYPDSLDQQEPSKFGPKYSRTNRKELDEDVKEDLRLKINGRERERMHDLNSAMDALRQVCIHDLLVTNHNTSSIHNLYSISARLSSIQFIVNQILSAFNIIVYYSPKTANGMS